MKIIIIFWHGEIFEFAEFFVFSMIFTMCFITKEKNTFGNLHQFRVGLGFRVYSA